MAKTKTDTIRPISEMKSKLTAIRNELQKTDLDSRALLAEYTGLIQAWAERKEFVDEMVRRSEMEAYHVSDAAKSALQVFVEQAEGYKRAYELYLEKELQYSSDLNRKITDINDKIMEISSIERFESLDSKLRELTAGTDIANDVSRIANDREIQQIVYTAEALISLNKERTLR